MAFPAVFVLSLLLGAVSFGVGALPLFFSYPRAQLARLSVFGNGMLLGAALGVIVPEGVDALADAHAPAPPPPHALALTLLAGFAAMLLVEQLTHSSHDDSPVLFDPDTELAAPGFRQVDSTAPAPAPAAALPLTLGLVVHALADGLSLGAAASAGAAPALGPVVLLAIAGHKAPTSVALTAALLAAGTPRATARRHLAVFSAATPLGTLLTYAAISAAGGTAPALPALALLFSGGTFLYVAAVLQPAAPRGADVHGFERAAILIVGLFVPFMLSALLGHGHGDGHVTDGIAHTHAMRAAYAVS